jgi:hypothetical protein
MKVYEEVDKWLHIFLILALDEGGVSYRPPVALASQEEPLVSTEQEAGWVPETV